MLEIRRLTKRYRNTAVVDDVSFSVRPGEVTGYLGPNGSGKSTTVKIVTGLIEPTSGKVLLDGRDIREDLIGFRRRLGAAGSGKRGPRHRCRDPVVCIALKRAGRARPLRDSGGFVGAGYIRPYPRNGKGTAETAC